MKKNRKGLMLVLSSPSGAGKTTICKEILKRLKNLNCQFLILQDQKEKVKLTERIIFLLPKKI